jgi:alpha-glucuronidase
MSAWDHKMRSGRTLWDELVIHYDRGIASVAGMRKTWDTMKSYVDDERWSQTAAFPGDSSKRKRNGGAMPASLFPDFLA